MYFRVELLLLALHATSTVSTVLLYNDYELSKMGAKCKNLDSCIYKHFQKSKDRFDCSCSSDCYKYGICCANSPFIHRQPSYKSSCESTSRDEAYYMVDTCPPTKHTAGQDWVKLCEDDRLIEDATETVPVTSTETQLTYKNIFCFKCNENTAAYVPWTIHYINNTSSDSGAEPTRLVRKVDDHVVILSHQPPAEVVAWTKACLPNTISDCFGRGQDANARRKCAMYLSYVSVIGAEGKKIYKNPHCAACNGENLRHMRCGIL